MEMEDPEKIVDQVVDARTKRVKQLVVLSLVAIAGSYLGIPLALDSPTSNDPSVLSRLDRLEKAVDDQTETKRIEELTKIVYELHGVIKVLLGQNKKNLGGQE